MSISQEDRDRIVEVVQNFMAQNSIEGDVNIKFDQGYAPSQPLDSLKDIYDAVIKFDNNTNNRALSPLENNIDINTPRLRIKSGGWTKWYNN